MPNPYPTSPRRGDSLGVLTDLQLSDETNSRLSRNAQRLASWVEWLLHPEEHEYDRTVIYPDGERREESRRVTKANPAPGQLDNPTITDIRPFLNKWAV